MSSRKWGEGIKGCVGSNLPFNYRFLLFGRAVKDLPVMKQFYAHSINSQGQRHRLDNHLKGTAERAADMAKEFGCSRWGWLAGLWHDLVNIPKTFRK